MKKIVLLIAIIAVGLLAACGNTASSSKEKKEDTRTYTMTNKKTVKIPAHPKKIVTEDYSGDLIALGIKPIATASSQFDNPFIKDDMKGVKKLGDPVSAEKVAELSPDLIIVSKEDTYKKLSKIAPTVLIPYGATKTVEEELTMFGELLNKKTEAKKWITDYHEKAKQARAKIQGKLPKNATFGIYEVQDKDFYIMGQNMGRGGQIIYHALGLEPPKKIKKDVFEGQDWKKISLEVLPDYAADYMFVTAYSSSQKQGERTLADMKESGIWKDLPALKKNHLFEMDFNKMFYYDPVAIEGQLDIIVDKLLKK